MISGASLQVLSLFEAEQWYELAPEEHLVAATPFAQTLMRTLPFDATQVLTFDYSLANRRQRYAGMRALADNVLSRLDGDIDQLLVGTPGFMGRALTKLLKPQRVVVLEDGTATLDMLSKLTESIKLRELARSFVRRALLRGAGLSDKPIRGAEIFTPLDIAFHPNGSVVNHHFPRLASLRHPDPRIDPRLVLVLGGGAKSNEELMREVLARVPAARGSEILFKPHPADRSQVAPTGATLLDEEVCLQPAESWLLGEARLPGTIVGDRSSALHTLPLLLPDGVRLIDVSRD